FFQTVTPLDTMRSGDMVVTGVDPENRVITVNSKAGSLGQNDVILVKSQRDVSGTPAWNSMLGLLALAGTTTGTLFNINVSKSIWAPNQYAVGGVLSFEKLQEALTRPISKGLTGDATCYTSIYSFVDLVTEQAALRRYGGSMSGRVTFDNGANELRFHYQTGVLRIKPSIYCPVANAVIVPSKSKYDLCRVGATDLTFDLPKFGKLIQISDTVAGAHMMAYYSQSLFTAAPGRICLLTGITSDNAPGS